MRTMQAVHSSFNLGCSSLSFRLAWPFRFLALSACNSNHPPSTAAAPLPTHCHRCHQRTTRGDRRPHRDRAPRCRHSVELRPRVSGHITEVRFAAGQTRAPRRRSVRHRSPLVQGRLRPDDRGSWRGPPRLSATPNGSAAGPMNCCGITPSRKKKPTVVDPSWTKRLRP